MVGTGSLKTYTILGVLLNAYTISLNAYTLKLYRFVIKKYLTNLAYTKFKNFLSDPLDLTN